MSALRAFLNREHAVDVVDQQVAGDGSVRLIVLIDGRHTLLLKLDDCGLSSLAHQLNHVVASKRVSANQIEKALRGGE